MSERLADAELAAYISAVRESPGPTPRELGATALRAAGRARAATRPRGPELAKVTDLMAGSVPVRLYEPLPELRSVVVYFHGGMWTIGDLESHDRFCRRIAADANTAVLAVDYRRAPEHQWPAAVDDCVAAVRWARPRFSGPLVVMGDSSGGNLAALVALKLRDEAGVVDAQVLVCPNTDLTLSQRSAVEKGTGWGLDTDAVAWGIEQWVPDVELRQDPRVSPLFATDLSGLPRTVVVTAEHDPLRDEGDAYAIWLSAAGVRVRHRREPGMVHGFQNLDTVSPAAKAAGDRVIGEVRRLVGGVG